MPRPYLLPALLACLLAGCASVPAGKHDPRDPFESYNRWMYRVNDAVDRGAVKPVARAYVRVLPQPVRTGVGNFFRNLSYPRTIVNDFLQGKFVDGTRDTARLAMNTVFGLGGILDPAGRMGLERHDEDFGQTLGRWGVPTGPYLVLPVLGPSSVRDGIGRVPDEYSGGRHYIADSTVRWSATALDAIDVRAGLLDTDSLTQGTFDRYAFIRNAWLQRRNYLVHDGEVDESPLDDAPDAAADSPSTDTPKPAGSTP
jgi:phospholipid-binding lipoprotein MlaA